MQVKWNKQTGGLSEIYSTGAEVALVNAHFQQVGQWAHCKDFIQDAFNGFINKKAVTVWGYKYNPATDPEINFDRARVLFTNSKLPDLESKLENIFNFLNPIESMLGLESTNYWVCDSPPEAYKKCGVSYWEGSPIWFAAPPLTSLWTLLIRNGSVHEGDDPMLTIDRIVSGKLPAGQSNDATYLKMGKIGLEFMIKNSIEKCFNFDGEGYTLDPEYRMQVLKTNYPNKANNSTMHHYGGIVSYSESHATTKSTFPKEWVYPEAGVVAPSFCHS